jgi:ribokinase
MKKICILGSFNIDFTESVGEFPKPGETVACGDCRIFYGGKGANQAIAARNLGADVLMAGKVGEDLYGKKYLERMRARGIRTDAVETARGVPTGMAFITVNRKGENTIIISSGANALADISFFDRIRPVLLGYDIFLLQLEIPAEAVEHAAGFLKANRKTVILDPAPAQELNRELYRSVDYITPNETEVGALTGIPVRCEADYKKAGKILLQRGVGAAVIKAGAAGAFLVRPEGMVHIPTYPVAVRDTTAAGDSFNAGLAVSLANGKPIEEAVQYANAVGALATQGLGAQDALPDTESVARFMEEHKNG